LLELKVKVRLNITSVFFNIKIEGTEVNFQALDKNPNIPRYLVDRKDYTIETMIAEIEDKIITLKETKKRKEQEEEEKREQAQADMLKEQQQKEKEMNEKRKKAEEVFFKRLEDKRKVQDELAKRNEVFFFESNKLY